MRCAHLRADVNKSHTKDAKQTCYIIHFEQQHKNKKEI